MINTGQNKLEKRRNKPPPNDLVKSKKRESKIEGSALVKAKTKKPGKDNSATNKLKAHILTSLIVFNFTTVQIP
jgi:hypothetical protein